MSPLTFKAATLLSVAFTACGAGHAAVSAGEAAKLKTELTPFGAERAGSKDGGIPAWSGGLVSPPSAAPVTGRRTDPFASEKPLFSITAANMTQYAEKLSEGSKALLKKYPESYRIDVYPTHRTAAAPQWVYDNTFKNATEAALMEGGAGPMPKGAFGGIPFPIPKNGNEAMWNHVLRWRGESTQTEYKGYQLTTDGKWVNVIAATIEITMPYYFKELSAASQSSEYWMARAINSGPPIRAGEGIIGRNQLDETRTQAWVYLVGQRRVRKLPTACCDTPTPFSAGLVTFDEVDTFLGRQDRFDWKLVGKQEMFIPYNTNRLSSAKSDAAVLGSGRHLNPDELRWELHRVWVVEATLKPGQRHVSPKSRYYLDEDSWTAVLSDRWDANGQLARQGFSLPIAMPDVPATANVTWGAYDLVSGGVFVTNMLGDPKSSHRMVPRPKEAVFSPDSMAGEGVR
jgi:hypothetical protein